jgi:sugar lactone lactonase YvrE
MTRWLVFPVLALIFLLAFAWRGGDGDRPERTWGRRGVRDGDRGRPRAIALDRNDRLFIVDFTARIQAYDRDGNHLGLTWATPDYRNGRPSGLSIDRDGNLIVADSHYHCFRIYDPDNGKELRCIKAPAGKAEGQLSYVSDVVQDASGFYYIAEFGETSRITKMDENGKFVRCWGSPGLEPGQLGRARALALGPDGNLYVADATNHRIQVFSRDGALVRYWGEEGEAPGQLQYPYDLAFNKAGALYVVEYGNHRVQKFTPTGESLGCWGGPGRAPGQLHCPWGLAIDSHGRIHVLDTENHRVQRVRF